MKTKEIKAIVKEQPFLGDLKPKFLDLLVGCASQTFLDKGHFLLSQGQDANRFYIITQGQITIEIQGKDARPVTIQKLGASDILGWSWLIPPYKWQFDALVLEPTSVIAFDGKCLRKKCEEDCELGYDMLKRITGVMAYRLYHTRMQLMDFYFQD